MFKDKRQQSIHYIARIASTGVLSYTLKYMKSKTEARIACMIISRYRSSYINYTWLVIIHNENMIPDHITDTEIILYEILR